MEMKMEIRSQAEMGNKVRWAGALVLAGMIAGVLSVAPVVDSANYLAEAAANPRSVAGAALFQWLMSAAYLGIAILLYPTLRERSEGGALGFLAFRIAAATLVMFGAVLLPALLVLSQEYAKSAAPDASILGAVLKGARDSINHGFMILALGAGNLALYVLLWKSKLVPRWLSAWGLLGNALSMAASAGILFQGLDVISPKYLAMNAPTAVQELIFGIWLIAKGFAARSREA